MNLQIPLEVLAHLAPILAWSESGVSHGLPIHWFQKTRSGFDRERSWFHKELPTYSFDNIAEISRTSRDPMFEPIVLPKFIKDQVAFHSENLSPPDGFNLIDSLFHLGNHYLKWSGSQLSIREGHLVEFHELAMRFPVVHIVRAFHAQASGQGYLSMENVFELPEDFFQLTISNRSARAVVEEGLTEGHIHLGGVLSAADTWAQQLMGGEEQRQGAEHARLVYLGRASLKIMALGIVEYIRGGQLWGNMPPEESYRNQFAKPDERQSKSKASPNDHCHQNKKNGSQQEKKYDLRELINIFDKLYLERNPSALARLKTEFERKLNNKIRAIFNANLTNEQISRFQMVLSFILPVLNKTWPVIAKYRSDAKQFQSMDMKNIADSTKILNFFHYYVPWLMTVLYPYAAKPKNESGKGDSQFYAAPKRQLWHFLHQIYFRYLIIHCHHWQTGTQSGQTTGLKYFQEHYSSKTRWFLNKDAEASIYSFKKLVRNTPLRQLEGRIAPPKHPSELIPWLMAFVYHAERGDIDRFGIVIHFIKGIEKKYEKRRSHRVTTRVRFYNTRRHTQREALRLFRLLSTPSPVCPFIVGIDAANYELYSPPEVFAPAFRFLREFPIELRYRNNARQHFGLNREVYQRMESRPLGMTYHVGEDFRHLLSGLRSIHEVIEYLKPNPGDRLGHALALGLNPANWLEHAGFQAVMPRLEWLDNLIWLHHTIGAGHPIHAKLETEDRIQQLCRLIYAVHRPEWNARAHPGKQDAWHQDLETWVETHANLSVQLGKDWTVTTLYDAWRLRQLDPFNLDLNAVMNKEPGIVEHGYSRESKRWANAQRKVLSEVDQHIGSNAAFYLLGRYWYSKETQEAGKEIMTIDMYPKRRYWIEAIELAQAKVQEMVKQQQLVIEANPSSNRLVGPINSLREHPIIKMTMDKDKRFNPSLHITVNTDNPGVHNTSLAHEYYQMAEVLLELGMSELDVKQWLRWVRKNGEDFSFLNVLPLASDAPLKQLAHYLEMHFSRLNAMVRGKSPIFKNRRKDR